MDADWSKVRVSSSRSASFPERPRIGGSMANKAPVAAPMSRTAGPTYGKPAHECAGSARSSRAALERTCADLRTESGVVKHTDGRKLGYGELAPLAATLKLPPEKPPLKDPKQFRSLARRRASSMRGHRHRPRAFRSRRDSGRCVDRRHHSLPDVRWRAEIVRRDRGTEIPGVRDVIALPGPKPGEPFTAIWRRESQLSPTTRGRRCKASAL